MEIGPLQHGHHLRLAYGVGRPSAPAPTAPTRALERSDAVSRAEATETHARLRGIVAASVPGRVSFEPSATPARADALPMYRHPAQRNAVATDVTLGRSLDVRA